jgi:hypothetical protein
VVSEITAPSYAVKSRRRFPLDVYVKNVGHVLSGEYDLRILIKNPSNGYKGEIGILRRKGLQPGEEVLAYSSRSGPINDPGSYQVQAEIIPFLFEDSTPGNMEIRDFTVA